MPDFVRLPRYFCFGKSTQNHLLLSSAYILRFAEKPLTLIQLAGQMFVNTPPGSGSITIFAFSIFPCDARKLPKSRKGNTNGKLNIDIFNLPISAFL
jgi:hypothetical protein